MSHFPRPTHLLFTAARAVLRRPRPDHRRRPHLGGRLPRPLGPRQDRAQHPRRELHRVVLLEDLRQGRHRDLGNPADRLPAHALGHAQPRAARLFAGRQLQLVPVQRQPRQVPDGARSPAQGLARSAAHDGAGPGLGHDRRRRRQAQELAGRARHGRLHPLQLGRGQRDHRRGQHPHHPPARPRPDHRLLADPGDVDGELRRRQPLSQPDRRREHELLRLVLRPAAGQPAGVGRADRRSGVGRLVQLQLHHRLGLQRAADAHAGRPLLHRGALQGHQDRGDHARLLRGRQALGPVAASQAGHGRRRGDGDGPRDPQGVLFRQARRPISTTTRAATPTCRCW